ncbi:uncharacterized protein [Ptychodera flava]|uniref:uncharacterized protein n=1 Tax=Ptychodera flava TaxID=63121 RepID=UPI00396A1A14
MADAPEQPVSTPLTRLKGTRRGHRASLTKLFNKAENLIASFDSEANKTTALDNLITLSELINSKYDILASVDLKIIESVDEGALEGVIEEADDYLHNVFDRKRKICRFIDRNSESSSPVRSNNGGALPTTQSTSVKTTSLPKLQLPTFSGDILKWVSFFDAFKSAVNDDKNLGDVQKFQYLRAQLQGEAARTIEGLSLTSSNYGHALQLLDERYGQKHKIISAYMKALWDMPTPTGELSSLRNFYDTLESYIRGLQSLGKSEESYGDLLVPIVLEKLPVNTRKQIAREHGNNEWNLADLRKAIYKEIDALQAGYSTDELDCGSSDKPSMTAAFHAKASPAKPKKSRACAYCKDSHFPNDCIVVSDRAKRLDIVKRDKLCFNCLGKHRVSECKSRSVVVYAAENITRLFIKITRTITLIKLQRQPEIPQLLRHTFNLQRRRRATMPISVLIGADYYWDFVEDRVIRGSGPTAVSSKFGYLLSGPIHSGKATKNPATILHILTDTCEEESQLKVYWDLETIGIKDELLANNKTKDDFELYRDTHLRIENGKYVARLPWKPDHPALPTNYNIAEMRTRSMARRLTPDILKAYDKIISDQMARDFIEETTDDESERRSGHYLPHHPVKKDSATTPIRIVYDCSCKQSTDSPSLNDCLLTGPPLLNDLTQILLRFRVNRIAFSSDIEKAFLHVRLDESDRQFTKFLWLSEPMNPESPFKTYCFKVILFGAVSSPFILNAVVKTHLESRERTPTSTDLENNIYVDNILSGTDSNEDAVEYYEESNHLFESCGFNLRSWSSNCEDIRVLAERDHKLEPDTAVNALGLRWLTETDELTYAKNDLKPVDSLTTKREVVRTTASLYDPLGYLSPVHVKAKVFIQQLWKKGRAWDEPLGNEMCKQWTDIAHDLSKTTELKFKRQYFDSPIQPDSQDYDLHVFADASKKAYGAVAYLRHGNETAIVMAKTRVAPLKELTLPQLELMAALVGSRLIKFLCNAFTDKLRIQQCILWSDSEIVLHWLNSDKKLPVFIANRVKEIRGISFTAKYCPTKENPADLLTRGISARNLETNKLWWNGPSWLHHGDWPISELFDSAVHHVSLSAARDDDLLGNSDQTGDNKIVNEPVPCRFYPLPISSPRMRADYPTGLHWDKIGSYSCRFRFCCRFRPSTQN